MLEYGFSLTCIFPFKSRIEDSSLIQGNTGQRKPVFEYILRTEEVTDFRESRTTVCQSLKSICSRKCNRPPYRKEVCQIFVMHMFRLPVSNASNRFFCATHYECFDLTKVTYLAFNWTSANFVGTTFISASLNVELQVAMVIKCRRVAFLISITLNRVNILQTFLHRSLTMTLKTF